ncbi:hypothetical protein CJ030_MR1G008041 [Morella rubra]|uniref:Retrotransposon Copia-like N-terminal domain-containing protein n=1 Tax=Morella rubra TaxID=262757 RepID=A0A6A1WN40_9ROSI|nr:hypothetical protein CJ030_MR1G008041 [Morella rubra]
MLMALSAKNKVGLIDDSILKPLTSNSDYAIWLRCNNMVISWIINSISRDLTASIIFMELAYKIWSDLKE